MQLTLRRLSPSFAPYSVLCILLSCSGEDKTVTTAFKVYAEMVANQAKPIAFHYPMSSNQIDIFWEDFETIAKDFEVSLYREDALPATLLFPKKDTEAKTVIIIYKGNRLIQYQQWKADVLASDTSDVKIQQNLARRLGRLLGYNPIGINSLLRKNSNFKDLAYFGITKQTTHLYYEDLIAAQLFYETTLGLPRQAENKFQLSKDGFIELHPIDSIHPAGQPKSTAIALLTDQLPQWYDYLKQKNIPIKYSYKPKSGGPHDGFVAIDPGGYLLEFEEFKQHPENELLMAILKEGSKIQTKTKGLSFFGTITWTYHKDIPIMQDFYEQVLGFELIADQGWTKIYQTAQYSFIGLVDECRGMENYAEEKAMELTWHVSKITEFEKYALDTQLPFAYSNKNFEGPENYRYTIARD